ncbi:MAG: hypothetical protein AAF581_14910 [Planctomycetota bacterium]
MSFLRKKVALEVQLEKLAEVGLVLNPGVAEAELTTFDDRAALESKPYAGLIEAMGMELEEEPHTPLCDPLWMCDYECIEDHGAYADVLRRLETLTGNAAQLTNITDHVDLEEEAAWVAFDARGASYRWELEVNDDWLDPQVLVRYNDLLESSKAAVRIYSNHNDYGQVAFLAAFTPAQKRAFDKLSKVRLRPLSRT